ncbi:MAG: hypothetical protein R3B41_01470 [Candidatus Doudnabacteria bacterium]
MMSEESLIPVEEKDWEEIIHWDSDGMMALICRFEKCRLQFSNEAVDRNAAEGLSPKSIEEWWDLILRSEKYFDSGFGVRIPEIFWVFDNKGNKDLLIRHMTSRASLEVRPDRFSVRIYPESWVKSQPFFSFKTQVQALDHLDLENEEFNFELVDEFEVEFDENKIFEFFVGLNDHYRGQAYFRVMLYLYSYYS